MSEEQKKPIVEIEPTIEGGLRMATLALYQVLNNYQNNDPGASPIPQRIWDDFQAKLLEFCGQYDDSVNHAIEAEKKPEIIRP